MLTGSPSVHPKLRKGFLSNFYHVTESDDDDDDDDDDRDDDDDDDDNGGGGGDDEFRLNDASIH